MFDGKTVISFYVYMRYEKEARGRGHTLANIYHAQASGHIILLRPRFMSADVINVQTFPLETTSPLRSQSRLGIQLSTMPVA